MPAILTTDALFSCLLLLGLSLLSLKLQPFNRYDIAKAIYGKPSASNNSEPLQRAAAAFAHFDALAGTETRSTERSYARIGRAHKRIGYEIGYPTKLKRLQSVTKANSEVCSLIAKSYISMNGLNVASANCDGADLAKVREVLKHFVRDWSEEGKTERLVTFDPILSALLETPPNARNRLKVLVPGSGLGRLAWEIQRLGFDTTAIELSAFMNLAFDILVSPEATAYPRQHRIHPFAHWFSHQRNNDAMFRAVSFPDTVPRLSDRFRFVQGDFLQMHRKEAESYDFIVTLFFIDTSLNIIETLEQIHRLLRPGGRWINLGPLLWTGRSQASLELSLEEVLHLADLVGFNINANSRRSVECEYTADSTAMMRWIYTAEFWTAEKRRP